MRAVRSGSAADLIAVHAGDVIYALAGVVLGSADDAEPILREVPKERPVPIRVLRRFRRGWFGEDAEISLD